MSQYNGPERRQRKRVDASFVVSYRVKEGPKDFDLSNTKNVSQAGMLLTTNKAFTQGTYLAMLIRFPLVPQKIKVTGEVVNSKEIIKNLIYETRIKFLNLDEDFFIKLGEFIKENLK